MIKSRSRILYTFPSENIINGEAVLGIMKLGVKGYKSPSAYQTQDRNGDLFLHTYMYILYVYMHGINLHAMLISIVCCWSLYNGSDIFVFVATPYQELR